MAFDPDTLVRQCRDPAEEVRACRSDCALFDFSFVGRARIGGPHTLDAIARLTQRPLRDLRVGQIRYAVRERPDGRRLSDLTIWRHRDHYEVMSGRGEDMVELMAAASRNCSIEDQSAATAIFAVQGPGALAALAKHADRQAIADLAYFTFTEARIGEVPCIVGRLGYTGEAGFEILLPRAAALHIWRRLAQTVPPASFVAADILRIEAGRVLFANEFRVTVTAMEAGLEPFAGPGSSSASRDVVLVCFRASAREKPCCGVPRVLCHARRSLARSSSPPPVTPKRQARLGSALSCRQTPVRRLACTTPAENLPTSSSSAGHSMTHKSAGREKNGEHS